MIRMEAQTETDLHEAVRLATAYAVDSFRAENREKIKEIPREEFIARCHDGFDLAQKLILKNLLSLEKGLQELRAKIRVESKGKKKKEIQRDEALQSLHREENRLVFVSDAFQRVADAIAWQILGMNKVLMRSTHTSHGRRGYLSDTNIASAVEAIEQLRKPGEFYLINDITLCLGSGAGDLLYVNVDRSWSFVELKTGAENARIFDFLDGFTERLDRQHKRIAEVAPPRSPQECEVHEFLSANSDLLMDRGKRKQVERVIRQMERMHNVLEYDRTNVGKDITLTAKGKSVERDRVAFVPDTQDEHAFSQIGRALTNVSMEAPYFSFLSYGPILTFLVTDNVKSELFSIALSPFVRMMNARHAIYHHINDNMADCALRKGPRQAAKEMQRYSQLFVLDWATQVIRDGSLMPPFLMAIRRDLIFDVLFGRKSIYVYFDHIKFAEFVTEAAAGKFILKADGRGNREWSGLQIQIPTREGRQGASMIGWGLIFRMLIEFQDPETMRRQFVEMVQGDEERFGRVAKRTGVANEDFLDQ
jgi:hypothetical protein